ncbi:MAG: flagellar hook-basal body complex protein [Campylobacterota bacterium]|nr:flagellar hook-basal body complex protein [Campylobacterota bacterium]
MMTQAFYTGLSGIRSNQTAIDVTSDNIANTSTTGFRANTVEFSSLFEEAISSVGESSKNDSIGVGTVVNATQMMQGVGSLQLTEKSTDLAIDGDGWFGVKNAQNQTFYTRAGDFVFDANSDLVTNDGMYVLGTMSGNIEGKNLTKRVAQTELADISLQENLRFPNTLTYPSQPTQNSKFMGSLDMGIDAKNIFSAQAIDNFNNKNSLKIEFTKVEPQVLPGTQWNVEASTIGKDGNTVYDTKNGVALFDEKGGMISNSLTTINNNGSEIKIDLGTGFDGIISNSSVQPVVSDSDGVPAGDLVGYDINTNAEVIAVFTNGEQSSVGKIALYHFQNEQGLEKISSTKYSASSNSGDATFFKDDDGKNIFGTDVLNYTLESSNVLLSQSLTELILLQRSFDSNSKVISTADQMMQKALDMDA